MVTDGDEFVPEEDLLEEEAQKESLGLDKDFFDDDNFLGLEDDPDRDENDPGLNFNH